MCFVTWKREWNEKTQDWVKIPTDPRTGLTHNAHDTSIHVSYEEAKATGRPIGLDIIPQYGRFFIDIDHCREGDGWKDLVHELCEKFKGCYVEVSQSGEGVHIIGRIPPGCEDLPHGCKRPDLGLEFYTEDRFCAITETHASGGIDHVTDENTYLSFILDYFYAEPATDTGAPAGWTTEPVTEWSGPNDDIELLGRMFASKSRMQAVGMKANFEDLFNADEEALSKFYPDSAVNQGRAFDWSRADSAICARLAFWTGKNCERMERLWGMSALADRDKYRDRQQYRRDTILNAVTRCKNVYTHVAAGTSTPSAINPDGGETRDGIQMKHAYDHKEYFKDCVYITSMEKVLTPKYGLLNAKQFKARYGGYVFEISSAQGSKTSTDAWKIFTESQVLNPDETQVDGTCFRPEMRPGEIMHFEGQTYVNVYRPVITSVKSGDASPFIDFISRVLPDDNDRAILLSYMAACAQYPGKKFQWAPVIQGAQGNGKSTITKVLSYCVGKRHTQLVNAADISNKFNAWILNKTLCIVDEMRMGNSATVDALKPLITETRLPIQAKGRDQTTEDIRANFIFTTNHKDGVVKDRSDRRYCVFFTAQQDANDIESSGLTGKYFRELHDWLGDETGSDGGYAIINNYLREYKIPDHLNPATECLRAPNTTSTEEAVVESQSPLAQEVTEAIEAEMPGFCGGWVSSTAVERLLQSKGHRVSVRERGNLITHMGYVKHCGLKDGRSTRIIPAENGKPRLYVRADHLSLNIENPGAVINAYCKAQNYPGVPENPAACVNNT